jgi:hypothetical protein
VHDAAAEGLADALVAQADAQDGIWPAKRLMVGTEMPASLGVQGPGEMTMRSGCKAATSATLSSSLRLTTTSSPSSPKYCTRL